MVGEPRSLMIKESTESGQNKHDANKHCSDCRDAQPPEEFLARVPTRRKPKASPWMSGKLARDHVSELLRPTEINQAQKDENCTHCNKRSDLQGIHRALTI